MTDFHVDLVVMERLDPEGPTSSGGSAQWHGKMETRPEHGIDELIAELAQARERVEAIYSKLRHARDTTLPRIGRTDDSALVVAGYLETYYTALETFFVRVSG